MIQLIFPTKKLFRTALYTSPLIAILASSPLSFNRSSSVTTTVSIFIIVTIFVFFTWSINIWIVNNTKKYTSGNIINYKCYLVSYLICITLAFLIRFILKSFILESEPQMHFRHISPEHLNRGPILSNFIFGFCLNTVVLIIQDLILLREKQAFIELENAQLKVKNIEATNQQLKQQIHPHFLFNSLNTLNTLIGKKPDTAQEYLVKLSDFLRGSISSGNYNVVKINEELKLCLDYLEMQKIRFNDALNFSINLPDEISNLFVPSFSMQLLIENAIKHNAFTEESPLLIKITQEKDRINVTNNIQKKNTVEQSTGIGLSNLAERYRIISGDELVISSSGDFFSISIKIIENEDSNYRR